MSPQSILPTARGLALLGCAALFPLPALAGSWNDEHIAGMDVELFLPDAAAPAGGRPLMVNLHGCSQDGDLFRERANWADTAERFGMVVALPTVPDGGLIRGCWDYWGKADLLRSPPPHRRDNRDNDNLLALVDALLARAELGLDPAQVYLSGLSSGAGQTLVLGCLAPEVFAGLGAVAGPSLGTAATEINPPLGLPVSEAEVEAACRSLAGRAAPHLETQVASIAFGTIDSTVSPSYGPLNAEVLAEVYGAEPAGTRSLEGEPGFMPEGGIQSWDDATGTRIELVTITGMGHAWPAGTGPGSENEFIATEGLDYPAHLTAFLTANNRRVSGAPRLEATTAVDDRGAVEISGEAAAGEGAAPELTVAIAGLSDPTFALGPDTVEQPEPPAFSFTSGPLPSPHSYAATVTATAGTKAASLRLVFGVGPDAPFPPELGEVMAAVVADTRCVLAFGTVSDRNGDAVTVAVEIDGAPAGAVEVAAEQGSWTLSEPVCGFAPGQHAIAVFATDGSGLGTRANASVTVPEAFRTVEDTLNGHVVAQRIRFYQPPGHFGAADVPFPELLSKHGLVETFPLFEIDDRFFAAPPSP